MVAHRGAAQAHRVLEDLLDRAVQAPDLLGRQGVDLPVPAQPASPHDLVGVDRPDAPDQLAADQQRPQPGLLGQQPGGERLPGEGVGERVDRGPVQLLEVALAGPARHEQLAVGWQVQDAQAAPDGEGDHGVGARLHGCGAALAPQATGGPEGGDQSVARFELHDQIGALPLDRGQALAEQALAELLAVAVTPDRPGGLDLHVGDLATDDLAFQIGTERLDLGQFGHSPLPGAPDDGRAV